MAKTHQDTSRKERSRTIQWVVTVFLVTIVVSGMISLISDEVMASSGRLAAFAILLGIVFLGIVFDIIGMAVATASEKPFHSMAAHKANGAQEALAMLRNAEKVSSFCNDVVGDICGVISGTASASLVLLLLTRTGSGASTGVLETVMAALVSGLTVGGKAIGKSFAMTFSTKIVHMAALVVFYCKTAGRAVGRLFCRKKKKS